MPNQRTLYFYKSYFDDFYQLLNSKAKRKVLWTLRLIEELDMIPEKYLKYIVDSDGLYEKRVKVGSDIFRVFCFFDEGNIVIVGNGFHKKSQKTPKNQIAMALKIKKEYYERK